MGETPPRVGRSSSRSVGGGEADDGAEGDGGAVGVGGFVEGEVAAGGVAEDGDAGGVAVVVGGVVVEPVEGGVDVDEPGGPAVWGGEAVVDGEAGDAGVVEGFVELGEVGGFVAGMPAAAVDHEEDGEGCGGRGGGGGGEVGEDGVEFLGLVVGGGVGDVGFDFGAEGGGEEEGEEKGVVEELEHDEASRRCDRGSLTCGGRGGAGLYCINISPGSGKDEYMTAIAAEREEAAAPGVVFRWDWVTWMMLGVLAVFVGTAFSPALKASFVDLDDEAYAFGNPHVLEGVSAHGLTWAVTTRTGGVYIPATWVSLEVDATISRVLGLDCTLAGTGEPLPDGTVYHATNLALHVTAMWMLFLFLYRATRMRWAAFAVALLWAVHPLRVESVAWVTERKDQIAGAFGFLAMYLYVAGRERGGRRGRLFFWLACGALVVSLCGKPMFVVMPALLVITDWWPLGRVRNMRELVEAVVEKWPMWVVVVANAAVAAYVARGNGTLKISELEKSGNALVSYIRYIVLQVDFGKLAPFYPYTGVQWAEVCGALVMLAAITCAAVWGRRRYPWVLAGWLWYLVAALPTIGFVQAFTQAYADRYSYLASVGLIGMVVFSVFQWRRGTAALVTSAVGVAVVLVVFTHRQTEYWRTSVALFERARDVTPMSKELHWSLATAYARANRLEEAERECAALISSDPHFINAYWVMTSVYQRQDRIEMALAVARKALEIAPENELSLKNYGMMLVLLGRYEEAAGPLEKAAGKLPEDQDVKAALARVREFVPPGVH